MESLKKLRARKAFSAHPQRFISGISTVTELFAQQHPNRHQTAAPRRGDMISKSIEGSRGGGSLSDPRSRESERPRVGSRRSPFPSKSPLDSSVKKGVGRNARRLHKISPHSSIVLRVRECLINAQQGVGVSTEHEYRHMVARLSGLDWRAAGIERGWTKSTFRTHRAASRWYLAKAALDALDVGKEAALTRDFVHAHLKEPAIRALAHDMERDENDETADATAKMVSRARTGKKPKSHAKRRSLQGLPDDWPWWLVHAMPTAEDKMATMVAIATGCRPAELRFGVQVTRLDQCRVRFYIWGAKVSRRTQGGQPWRGLVIDTCQALGPVAGLFLASLPKPGRTRTVSISGGAWQKKLKRRVANLGWPNVSAYTLRHRLASILKCRGFEDDAISQVLGHASDLSRRRYGMFVYGRGSGRHGIESVETASEVRQHNSSSVAPDATGADGGMNDGDAGSADQSQEQGVGANEDAWSDDDLLGDFDNSGPSLGM